MRTEPNNDSREMQPLPWRVQAEDKCSKLVSASDKEVATFWGNDERVPKNYAWPTTAQRLRHVEYAAHACNHFPKMQQTLVTLYGMKQEEGASALIEKVLNEAFFEGVPPYVG